jgi:hypothetical protein
MHTYITHEHAQDKSGGWVIICACMWIYMCIMFERLIDVSISWTMLTATLY